MIEPRFNAWIFQDNLKKVKSINSKIYKKIEKHFNDKIYYSNTWHCNVWSTFQKNQNFQKESKLCSDLIIVPAKNILQELGYDTDNIKMEGWFNAYKGTHWQEYHNHLPCILSGVYFVSFDKDVHGKFIIKNPHDHWRVAMLGNPKINLENINDPLYKAEFTPNIQQSDLIIFPSGLDHRVELKQNSDKKLRITFSFNFYF